jgi:UDP-N-acetylmuramoyl-L-alanyl-D-glutamate--2,6-diaminopimelate ligase
VTRILQELLEGLSASGPGLAVPVTGVAYRSDRVVPGDAFFCVPGLTRDGHDFAADAVARGAVVAVTERELPDVGAPQVRVPDARSALAVASARFFGEPTQRLEVVGITGTNGKTTTAYLVESIARAAGRSTGLIGTVETLIRGVREPAGRTTPESRDLQELFARMAHGGVRTVAMEVSSHALALDRVRAVRFQVAAFTNLSQDHLDFHTTMDDYLAAKASLFTSYDVTTRVVSVEDEAGRRLAADVRPDVTVGREGTETIHAADLTLGPAGSDFTLATPEGSIRVRLPLAGDFNVSNALVAAACGHALGIGIETIAAGLAAAPQVPGRLERVEAGQDFAVLVDYAHTPDGLAKAIAAVRGVTGGRVITVFGCGGDRDPAKRPLMGKAAGSLSDVVVVTSDNPRSERPEAIIAQVRQGVAGTRADERVEPDRRRAIALALGLARAGDAVLLAGKGHEDYQIFADGTVHFDDREVALEELRELSRGEGARC